MVSEPSTTNYFVLKETDFLSVEQSEDAQSTSPPSFDLIVTPKSNDNKLPALCNAHMYSCIGRRQKQLLGKSQRQGQRHKDEEKEELDPSVG